MTKLNEQQLKPVTDADGQILVVAGAGSGKTRVLTHRVAYLIRHAGVDPYNILAITFTNKAANEMKARINGMLGEDNPVWVSTFHSMANRILRAEIDRIGYDKNFSIYAESDVDKVIKRIIRDRRLDDKDSKLAAKVRWHISNAKNAGKNSERYALEAVFPRDGEEIIGIFKTYEEEMKNNNALDFDDLLIKTAELFALNPDVLSKYSKRFRHILIDEFQDTNKIQYLLLKMLSSYHLNIFAVGDDDQSIYGFRGADISNILNFKKDFGEARIYKLERNYRSTGAILNAANAVIAHNPDRINKRLWTESEKGESVVIKEAASDRDEAEYVISKIAELRNAGAKLSDIAVLVRQNSLTRLFEERLNLYGLPYRLFGGFKFYERKEIKDVVCYMKMLSNRKDRESIFRVINVPKRGIGEAVLNKLDERARETGMDVFDVILDVGNDDGFSGAAKRRLTEFRDILSGLIDASVNLPLAEYVRELVRIAGFEQYYGGDGEYADRYENIVEFVNAVGEFAKDNPNASAEDFLQSVALVSDADADDTDDSVALATIHAVKGLEFKAVFITGLEENLFPSSRSLSEDGGEQEERRVMYVAITRAKERLFMTYAKTRFRFNEVLYGESSRFVKEAAKCPDVTFIPLPEYCAGDYGYKNDGTGGGYKRGGRGGNYGVNGYGNAFGRMRAEDDAFLTPERAEIERMTARLELGGGFAKNAETSWAAARISQALSGGATNPEIAKYRPGVKVFHKKFGEGTVVFVSGTGNETVASIAFAGLGIKKFSAAIAPLKIIGE